jgi:phytoene dehydrogenase-like protein
MNRRRFLLGTASALGAAAAGFGLRPRSAPIEGELLGASYRIGHLLRGGGLPAPAQTRRVGVAIVGGGVAGLSAGWKLARAGFTDFEIFELEAECGGNSRCGENSISRFPWGAHYVPVPSSSCRAVRELFEELGVIEGYDSAGAAKCREEYLCFSPQERLFLHGRWQEGLLPLVGATRKDLDEYARFKELMHEYRERRGADGRRAFVIPMELSSRDDTLLALDRISIERFLLDRGFTSRGLHWYVDYACRDDFGCRARDVSAWAGVHYFASRGEDAAVLTWPEGNGWLVRRLRERLADRLRTDALVHHIEQGRPLAVDVFDPIARKSTRVLAEQVIFCAPTRTAKFVLAGAEGAYLDEFEYAPWMVANLTLRGFPAERRGPPVCWDNVLYDSRSLGYVVATHQSLRTHFTGTVFTYYQPLADESPAAERARLLSATWADWTESIVRDLERPHPDIRDLVSRVDVFRWGHAMVRPRPGFLWSDARRRAALPIRDVHFANSDLSGFSLFEEAQYRGVHAAERVLERLRVPFTSSL